ncbi:alpha/beta hydrolase-fold protein [Coralloluteibacterium stylophorae]|nr:alpha/beta hydrolase-fold protein [Coralloluteibacterium stylophorae]
MDRAVPGHSADVLVVVLPGRGDDLETLSRRDLLRRIRRHWPQADVLLTGATLAYYREGRIARRLHDEVVAPARRAGGYRRVWFTGISLGGLGALVYESTYPDQVEGVVLLGPYLGDRAILEEIAAAGGIGSWAPGPAPAAVTEANFQREVWRRIQALSDAPARAARIHLAYGERDRFNGALPLMRQVLPDGQVHVVRGGHDWQAWYRAAETIFGGIEPRQARFSASAPSGGGRPAGSGPARP